MNWKLLAAAALCASSLLFVGCSQTAEIPPEVSAGTVQTEDFPVINSSAAVEMVIPDVGIRANFDQQPCRVKNGAIDPESLSNACTYTANDRPYVLPGTNAADLVVIAGHTGAGIPAVFNNLYDGGEDRHTIGEGAKLYVRTEASGDRWLVYRATDFHSPQKGALSGNDDIWGTDATPGRLLTISCIQPANPLANSVRNAVIGWYFEGVVGGEEAATLSTPEAPAPVPSSEADVPSHEEGELPDNPEGVAPEPVAPEPVNSNLAPAPAPVVHAPAPASPPPPANPAPAPVPGVPPVEEQVPPAAPAVPELPPIQLLPLPEGLPPLPPIELPQL